jgi:hypothetical protein
MTTLLFANNATSLLTTTVGSSSTTINITPGTGSLFPDPTGTQGFYATIYNAGATNYEIVLVTARSSDTLTVVRGQDNTSPQTWVSGDSIGMYPNAGTMQNLVQVPQLQQGTYTFGTAGGSANALTGTINSPLTFLYDGFSFTLESAYANTGAATLTLTLGSTVLTTHPIVKAGNQALIGGEIPAAGFPCQFTWSATFGAFVLTNAVYIPTGLTRQVVYQTFGGFSFNSSSYVPTNITASITPISTSSKIIAIASFSALALGGIDQGAAWTLYRNSTNLSGGAADGFSTLENGYNTGNNQGVCGFTVVDSPSSTSAVTYTVYGSSTGLFVMAPGVYSGSEGTTLSTLTLIEVY